jgi:hypothetical protein
MVAGPVAITSVMSTMMQLLSGIVQLQRVKLRCSVVDQSVGGGLSGVSQVADVSARFVAEDHAGGRGYRHLG